MGMRRAALFIVFLLVIPLASRILATSQQAHQDYLFQFDTFRQTYNEFKIAKNEYEKFKSLASESVALEKTKLMLSQRDQLLRAYLLLLNEKLNENTGLSSRERQLYQSLLQNEVGFLQNHSQLVSSIGSIADAQEVSEQLESHYDILQATVRQTIIALTLGNLTNLARSYDQISTSAQSLTNEYRGTFSPQKQATMDRWQLQIANKKSLYQQKVDTIASLNSQLEGDTNELNRTFALLQQQAAEAKQYLAEGTSFLGELVTALKYQD